MASIIITSVFYVKDYPKIVPILFMTVGFGVIGFLDDYLKVVLRRSDGLLAWQKMLCQIVVTTVFAVYMGCYSDVDVYKRQDLYYYLSLIRGPDRQDEL